MLILGSVVRVVDKSGVVLAECIQVVGHFQKRVASVGSFMVVTVRWVNARRMALLKDRWQRKYRKGTIHRAFVVRSRKNICRQNGIYISFSENSVVLVTTRGAPVTNRIYGPILHEMCMLNPGIGCISGNVI